MSDGLPVSMMSVGYHFNEPAIVRAVYAFEQMANWPHMQRLQPYYNTPLLATANTRMAGEAAETRGATRSLITC